MATVGVEAQTTVLAELYREGFRSTHAAISILHDSLVDARRTQGVSAKTIENSVAYGAELGRAILAWAAQDSFAQTRGRSFIMPVGPQYWVPTATEAQYRSENLSAARDMVEFDNPTAKVKPGEASERSLTVNRPRALGTTLLPGIDPTKPVEPYWGHLRPFALPTADTCQAAEPIPFATRAGTPFYEQAKRVYDVSRTLSEEQRRIREQLEQMKQDDEAQHQLLGRLDDTGREMKQVEEALRDGTTDGERLEQQQQHILSRLLDAQRSLNRQDFDPERESKPGEELARRSPAELPAELLRETDRLRLDLLKAEADRYPAQYRAFIETYLRSLNGSRR